MSLRNRLKKRQRRNGTCQECDKLGALPCYLPEPWRTVTVRITRHGKLVREEVRDRFPDELLCPDCCRKGGCYCVSCGEFWGGIESFDFIHPGICDHCHDQIRADMDYY